MSGKIEIKQFKDQSLAHYSYAVISEGRMAVIDPARDPAPYYDFAKKNKASIKAVIETHPHADFVSSHLEIHQTTGATIYCSKILGAKYPHRALDEGQVFQLGVAQLTAWNTPGHSPDSISIILSDESGKDKAVFTGDTLFIGDCGRPDLRENAGNTRQAGDVLSRQMYHSLKKFLTLEDDVVVYPAHGAGSLCGRSLSNADSGTIGDEKSNNWCLQAMPEDEFVTALNEQQPFVPAYFSYDVEVNTKGAPALTQSLDKVKIINPVQGKEIVESLNPERIIIDTRDQKDFKKSHLPNAINIQAKTPFETWLGSLVAPHTPFYLTAENDQSLKSVIYRTAKIGYESFIEQAFVLDDGIKSEPGLDLEHFRSHSEDYLIIDVRNEGEVKKGVFKNSFHIPLPDLEECMDEIPRDKPIVVHCASGFRSAVAQSILSRAVGDRVSVFDLGEAVKDFI